MAGWVKIHRGICDHWLWGSEPFTKAQAWIDILLNANHQPAKVQIKNQIVSLERGQQARSEITLCNDWKWSRGKVRRFLFLLESDGMIVQQTSALTSIITVCNYDNYQGSGTADDTTNGTAHSTTHDTTSEQHSVHKQECKNDKNEENDKDIGQKRSSRFVPPTESEVIEYMAERQVFDKNEAGKFFDFYESKGWMVGKNKMKDWRAAIRNWLKNYTASGNAVRGQRRDVQDFASKDYRNGSEGFEHV